MHIRRAEEKDIEKMLDLLSQVLEIHAAIRPDLFVPGSTKYTREELIPMFSDENRRIYVAVDNDDIVRGYAFCEIRENPSTNTKVPFKYFYIDDLCVDENSREHHIGKELVKHVEEEAKNLGCFEITLNVWEGNNSARAFYDKIGFHPKYTTMEFIL